MNAQSNQRRTFIKKVSMLGAMAGFSGYSSVLNARQQKNNLYDLKNKPIPVCEGWDVIVVGGGPSGCAAAIAAAREGAKTLLIEATGALGGMGTSGLLNVWCPFTDKREIIYNGIAEKVLLESKKGVPHVKATENDWVPINTEHLKCVYDTMVVRSGASVLLFSHVCAVEMKDNERIESLVIANKAGMSMYKAKVYIDCTGDGDLAAWAGAKYLKGSEDGELQSATLCFSLVNVNHEEYMKNRFNIEGYKKESPIHAIFNSGKYPFIVDRHFNVKMAAPSVLMFNAGHIPNLDSSDPQQLTAAILRGRQLVNQLHEALKEFSPAIFGDSYLSVTGSLLGIREGRRIEGDYIFTIDDWIARRSFDDEIGRNSYYIDVHKKGIKRPPRYEAGESHGIPFRCLTPKGMKNVLTAGRCISTDMMTYGSLRVMPPCLVTGEASGLAAGLAVKSQIIDIHSIDVSFLRKRLKEEGQNIR